MDRQPVLEGERLLLRPLAPDDWEALFGVASDPQVWAVHPMPDRWQEPVFRAFFDEALAHRGALVVIDKASGRIVGSSQFKPAADAGGVEIGWTFLGRDMWGTGANREMKRLMVEHALKWVDRVTFRVGEDNVISRKAMANIGARLTDRIEFVETPKGAIRYVVFAIDRAIYSAGPLAN